MGGVLSLASGTPVLGKKSQWGCDLNFQFFAIETWDTLHLCLLLCSGSDHSQPLLGTVVYPRAPDPPSENTPWFQGPAYIIAMPPRLIPILYQLFSRR